jgi:plastocyanin
VPIAVVAVGCNAIFGVDDFVVTDDARSLAAGGHGGVEAPTGGSATGAGSSGGDGGAGGEGGCAAGGCVDPACDDLRHNGDETGMDCGGSCPPCADGLGCASATDCTSAVCESSVCAAPSCTDRVANGTETGTDCGSTCPPCPDGEPCMSEADCQSAICNQGVCSLLNGCSPVTAIDLTAQTDVLVAILSQGYDPKCFTILAGTPVTFTGSFSSHDLYGGEVKNGNSFPDPASPFMPPTTSGSNKTFDTLVTPGHYGFYCKQHSQGGAMGAVFVVP